MRFTSAIAVLVALCTPNLIGAQATGSGVDSTVTSYSYTTTITKTLIQVNATSTIHIPSKPTAHNGTETTSKYTLPSITQSESSSSSTSAIDCENCLASGADVQQSNLVMAAMIGTAALVWSSL